jgi:putative copper export protein
VIRAAQSVYFTALGLWVGGLGALGAIVAPSVFRTAPSRADAGRIFGSILRTFGVVELVLAGMLLGSACLLRRAPGMRWGTLRAALVMCMCLLAVISVCGVDPAVAQAAGQVRDAERTPEHDPGRVRFQRLHQWSERLAGTTLLVGFVLLVLSGASFKPGPDGA